MERMCSQGYQALERTASLMPLLGRLYNPADADLRQRRLSCAQLMQPSLPPRLGMLVGTPSKEHYHGHRVLPRAERDGFFFRAQRNGSGGKKKYRL